MYTAKKVGKTSSEDSTALVDTETETEPRTEKDEKASTCIYI